MGSPLCQDPQIPVAMREKTIWLTMMDKVFIKSYGLTPIQRRVVMIAITPSKMMIAFMPPSLSWKKRFKKNEHSAA
jgi:hypothetical protein